ncbi:Phosphoglycerate dehydrogenase [Dyadobacter koreensis]|uniref:Phosphoglycerate dehydrogenase n=1 Tax=Dyadobacter koreensis TaxID=408657 RepID=A0A1H6Q5X9_9BACT|nr:NAD(P)-dependent oxidoreductase [Dyadobacter koreensis]SEI37296.1 Phosphoglycerate dehydrogenase [Dyadobacter koreensis]
MKILVYLDFDKQCQKELIERLPKKVEVVYASGFSESQLNDALQDAEILVGNPPVKSLKTIPESLKFWQLEHVGFEQYKDLDFKGKVANVGDMSAKPVAETIVSGILAFYRGVHNMVRNQIEKEWVGEKAEQNLHILGEKRVIILGSGAIAEHVRKILKAFGCEVLTTAKSDPDADIHSFKDLLKELPETDLVINTLPGNLEDYVSKDFFDEMKKDSLYASVGRGNTTNEPEMIKALQDGRLLGAVLDVTEVEPLPKGSKLWTMRNVILTQHTGAAHKDRNRDKIDVFVKNIKKYLSGKKIEDEVALNEGY